MTFTVSYTGASTVSLSTDNVTVSSTDNASAGSTLVSGSGTGTRTVTLSNLAGDGTLSISLASGTASDEAGNQALSAGPSSSFTVDNSGPSGTVAIATEVQNTDNTTTLTLTLTASDNATVSAYYIGDNSTQPTSSQFTALSSPATAFSDNISYSLAGSGTRTVYAWFMDPLANITSTPVTATTLAENTAPTLSSVSLSSTGIDPKHAKSGDNLTLSFTGSEALQTPTVTLAGSTASPTSSDNLTWSASLAVTSSVPEGSVSFQVEFKDLLGNAGNAVSATTDSSGVRVDRTAPTVSLGSPSLSLTRTGPVTVTVSYTDADNVTLSSDNVTVTATDNASAGSKTVSGSGSGSRTITLDNLTGDGTLAVTLVAGTALDNASNPAPAVGPGTSFTVDNTAPSASVSYSGSGIFRQGDSMTIVVSFSESLPPPPYSLPQIKIVEPGDNTTGPVNLTGSGSSYSYTHTVGGGNGTASISLHTATDRAGNTVTATPTSGDNFTVDNTAPSGLALLVAGGDNYTKSTGVSLTLSGSDNHSVTGYFLSESSTTPGLGNFTSVTAADNYSVSLSLTLSSGDGAKTVHAWLRDAAGNIGGPTSDNMTLDTVAPSEVTISLAGGDNYTTTDNVTVTLAGNDNNSIKGYFLSESATTPGASSFTSVSTVDNYTSSLSFTLSSGDGTKTLYAWLRDVAGNVSGSAVDNITLDTTVPTSSIGSPSTTLTSTGPVTFTVSYTGADNITLVDDNVTVISTGTAASGSKAVTGSGTGSRTITLDNLTGDGSLTVSIPAGTANDLAGNSAPAANAPGNFTLDTSVPTVVSILPANDADNVTITNTPPPVQVTFSEAMDTTTVTTGSASTGSIDTTCTGSLQLSSDNFSTELKCRELGTVTTSDNKTFSATPIALANSSCPRNSSGSCTAVLVPETGYQIKITSAVKDPAGNFLNGGSDNTSYFTSKVRPKVSTMSPDNKSTDVSVFTAPSLHFSQPMTAASLTTSSVTVSPSPSGGYYVDYDTTSDNLTVFPVGTLADNTTYSVTVDNKEVYGTDEEIFLSPAHTFQFTTRDNLTANLLAYYPLDNDTLDHGNADGTLQDGTGSNLTAVPGRDNDSGGAFEFNGTSSKVTITGSEVPLSDNLTVSAWVRPGNLSSTYHTVVGVREAFNLKLEQSDGKYYVSVHINTGSWNSGKGSTLVELDQWHHLAATYDGATVRLYLNGELDGSFSKTGSLENSGDLLIGARANSSEYFQGRIDDVRIFSRALASTHIQDLFVETSRELTRYYPFYGTAKNLMGSNSHGTVQNSASSATGRSGSSGHSYEFNGGNQYIEVPYSSGMNIVAPSDFSINLWVRPATLHNGGLFSMRGTASTHHQLRTMLSDNGSIEFSQERYGEGFTTILSSDNYTANAWHHLVFIQDNATMKIYLNAKQVASGSFSATTTNPSQLVDLGLDRTTQTNRYLNGRLDDVRFYPRTLHASEISALYSTVDSQPPVPDNRSVDNSTSTLSWNAATDDYTAQASLEYRVMQRSDNRIATPETALGNGTAVSCGGNSGWQANLTSCTVSGSGYFTVLVRDAAGNISVYSNSK
ncbi:MAG: Ig-like domain-containing protein [SAR324 cluster bacterium]|nr:Ig-like domain-containing protein [SAR324 cluster bacterium]